VFNYLGGSLARVFTTLSEVNDPIILYGFLGGFALNVVLAAQMLFYWNAGSNKQSEAAKPKKQQLAAPAAATPSGRKSPKPKSGGRKKA
jgi:mannose-P-dolichol utilization defect protein 1